MLTVTSIAIIALLCDVILPDGQTRKYIKTVLGIVVTFVIVQPLLGVFAGKYDVETTSSGDFSVQEHYLTYAEQRQDEQKLADLKITLESKGLHCADLEVSASNKVATVNLSDKFDVYKEQTANEIAERFFPSYKIIIHWK